jgi:hypothetical protein
MDECEPKVVIFMGLEESFYILPTRKANDAAFHVDRDLVAAGKKVELRLLKLMNPIWELTI